MNKLLFSEGGQPLHLDDLEYYQTATHGPLEALLASWGDCILGGCEITYDKTTSEHRWTAGYIAFRGKVYRAEAGVFAQVEQANNFYWLFSKSEEAVKTFEDGTEHPTQLVYRAQLVSTRHDPEEGDYIADRHLPRLGVDFARSPRLNYIYDGQGEFLNFKELSRYSGIITLYFDKGTELPSTGHFGVFRIAGVNNMEGRYAFTAPELSPRVIDVVNGKLLLRKAYEDSTPSLPLKIDRRTYVSILISWDYEEDNGRGAGINDQSYGGGEIPHRGYDYSGGVASSGSRPRRRN